MIRVPQSKHLLKTALQTVIYNFLYNESHSESKYYIF